MPIDFLTITLTLADDMLYDACGGTSMKASGRGKLDEPSTRRDYQRVDPRIRYLIHLMLQTYLGTVAQPSREGHMPTFDYSPSYIHRAKLR